MESQEKYEVTPHVINPSVSMFLNEERFEFAQRIGKMLAASTMLPDHFRSNLGNCLIALNLAERLGIDVFGLMQTSYVVHGRPGFEAKLLIALFNSRSQLFIPPLRWEIKGDFPKGKDAACRAYAIDKDTKEPLYGEWIDWPLVKAEGWDSKNGSKWLTIPGQMFRYRSASFFINVFEPGLKMGIRTVDEIEDSIIDITPERTLKPSGSTEALEPGADPYKTQDLTKNPTPQGGSEEADTSSDDLPPSPPPSEKIAIEAGPETLDSKVLFRNEWANLRTAGYSTFIHKHFARIEKSLADWPDLEKEMVEKWIKFYPENPWPLVKKAAETEEAPKAEAENGNGSLWHFCPVKNARIHITACQKCSEFADCEERWIYEDKMKLYAAELGQAYFDCLKIYDAKSAPNVPLDMRADVLKDLQSALDRQNAGEGEEA